MWAAMFACGDNYHAPFRISICHLSPVRKIFAIPILSAMTDRDDSRADDEFTVITPLPDLGLRVHPNIVHACTLLDLRCVVSTLTLVPLLLEAA